MKLLFQLLFVAVFAYTKVAGNQFECYKCSGDDCKNPATLVDCYVDSPLVTQMAVEKAADENYACYTIHFKDNEILKSQKGCTNRKTNQNPCDSITPPTNITMVDCILCSEPKCNSSQSIHLSIAAIAIAIYMRLLM